MTRTVYTNYWINQRADVKKKHGSFATEKEAVAAIYAWWELHNEAYHDVEYVRTNTGALEIVYGDANYYYRVEQRTTKSPAPKISYRVKTRGEIEALRQKHLLDEQTFLFDELPEPYRDRIMTAMGNIQVAREYSYNEKGQPIIKAFEKV